MALLWILLFPHLTTPQSSKNPLGSTFRMYLESNYFSPAPPTTNPSPWTTTVASKLASLFPPLPRCSPRATRQLEVLPGYEPSLVNSLPRSYCGFPLVSRMNAHILTKVLVIWSSCLSKPGSFHKPLTQATQLLLLFVPQASLCRQDCTLPVPSTWSTVPREHSQGFPHKRHLPIKVLPGNPP